MVIVLFWQLYGHIEYRTERKVIMKKFKKIIAMGCAAIMAMSVMSMSAFATENSKESEEKIYFIQMDEHGNDIKTIPLVKTIPGEKQAKLVQNERASKPIWDLSSQNYSTTKSGYALFNLPYRFTGTRGYRVYVTANMTVPGGTWAEIAINNVTNGTSYMGSVEMEKSGNLFSISGRLHGISLNNYYTYTMQASSNCTYSDIELYQQ